MTFVISSRQRRTCQPGGDIVVEVNELFKRFRTGEMSQMCVLYALGTISSLTLYGIGSELSYKMYSRSTFLKFQSSSSYKSLKNILYCGKFLTPSFPTSVYGEKHYFYSNRRNRRDPLSD